jgi:hypothetical protein
MEEKSENQTEEGAAIPENLAKFLRKKKHKKSPGKTESDQVGSGSASKSRIMKLKEQTVKSLNANKEPSIFDKPTNLLQNGQNDPFGSSDSFDKLVASKEFDKCLEKTTFSGQPTKVENCGNVAKFETLQKINDDIIVHKDPNSR